MNKPVAPSLADAVRKGSLDQPTPCVTSCPPGALPHIRVHQLAIRRGDRMLFQGLDVTIPRGAVVAITGPSGIGKTSFLESLAGSLTPSEGRIEYHDASGKGQDPAAFRRRVGVIFQEFLLTPGLSALTNVLCGSLGRHPWWRTLAGFPAEEQQKAIAWLDRVHLHDVAHRPVSLLSGGEQQRVAIARALLQNPEVILADEPVSNLDATLAWEMMDLLRQECRNNGRTLLCVLHDTRLVESFADIHLPFGQGH